jgi:hypothetical protein
MIYPSEMITHYKEAFPFSKRLNSGSSSSLESTDVLTLPAVSIRK